MPLIPANQVSFVRYDGVLTAKRRTAIFERHRAVGGALPPLCYTPTQSAIRAEVAARILRRGIATLIELACIGAFLAAVLIWAAIGAGA